MSKCTKITYKKGVSGEPPPPSLPPSPPRPPRRSRATRVAKKTLAAGGLPNPFPAPRCYQRQLLGKPASSPMTVAAGISPLPPGRALDLVAVAFSERRPRLGGEQRSRVWDDVCGCVDGAAPVGAGQHTGAASAVASARSEAPASPSAHACPTPPDLRPVALARGLVGCWQRDLGTGRNPSPAAQGSTTVTLLGAISLLGGSSWSSSSPPPSSSSPG
jgi:hypothetical protein